MFHFSRMLRQSFKTVVLSACVLVVSIAQAAGPSTALSRDEIGELLIVGLQESVLTAKTEKHLLKLCPGSILLFRRNLVSNSQTQKLIRRLQQIHAQCSRQPLFLGVDQEGGFVSRIPFDPPLPSAWAVGQTNNPDLAEALGYEVGKSLRRLGFNMNLAPVLDLGSQSQKSFIGTRAFGDDPDLVARMGSAYSMGLIRAQVLPVAKHYPGLGSGERDPHLVIVRRSVAQESLQTHDLKPFRAFADLFPSGMMPSHLVYPLLDPQSTPGTFSRKLLRDWLRDDMSYQGLVVSDDLQMKGAQEKDDIGQATVAALTAGVDIAMISWSQNDQLKAAHAIRQAVQNKVLSATELREKISRIRKIKKLLGQPPLRAAFRNDGLMVQGSLAYTRITSRILKQNLARLPAPPARARPERVFIWPNDIRAKWQIERILNQKVYTSQSREFKSIGSDDLILAFVRNRKTARQLNLWSKSMRAQTVVVNQVEPGLIAKDIYYEIPIFMSHPMLASEVIKRVHRQWKIALVANRPEN